MSVHTPGRSSRSRTAEAWVHPARAPLDATRKIIRMKKIGQSHNRKTKHAPSAKNKPIDICNLNGISLDHPETITIRKHENETELSPCIAWH
jgi:hypothetical protein